jgi:hypothetical protein
MPAVASLWRNYRVIAAILTFDQRVTWRIEEWASSFRYQDGGYVVARLMALAEPPNPLYRPRNDYMHPWNWGPD